MIFLKLTDGLGNQMFQYAYARYLQSVYGGKIFFDITKLGSKHVRKFELNNFVLNKNVIVPAIGIQYFIRIYTKIVRILLNRIFNVPLNSYKGFSEYVHFCGYYTTNEPIKYYSFVHTSFPIKFVRGFFQSPKYFNDIKNDIRNDLRLKFAPNSRLYRISEEIKNSNSVCLHIRRGDFSLYNRFMVCNEKYYKRGIDVILSKVSNPVFFVFSNNHNDIEWIKNNYKFDVNMRYVDMNNSAIEDFYLMQQCKNFIISNSTFSWWAAYLANNINKCVVAPHPWIRGEKYVEDIYDTDWDVIKIENFD